MRILNELNIFIESLTFNNVYNVWSAPSPNISWLRQPQAASNLPFFLGWLEEYDFVVCLPKNKVVRHDKLLYTKYVIVLFSRY